MRISTGLHPRAWHFGAWILVLLLLAIALVLTHRATGGAGAAFAEPAPPIELPPPSSEIPATPPNVEDAIPDTIEPPEGMRSDAGSTTVPGYVTEIVDSTYTVGPAEFFALVLPADPPGRRATHILGNVSTRGKGKDIVVRIFRATDYDRWLKKKKSGEKAGPLWTSPRARTVAIDRDLPPGEPLVILLDNGFSLRTPKVVRCQIQLQYEATSAESFDTEGSSVRAARPPDAPPDNLPTPRSNEEENIPPPPPPPPDSY